MTLQQIAQACHGTLCIEEAQYDPTEEVAHVAIDSRKIMQNDLFIATKGERVDGHSFIAGVAEQGALGVVCEKKPVFTGRRIPYILVEDSFIALKEIAEYYRQSLQIKVVGITGSVGKTSTKEFIASVLSTKYNVLKTQGNLNNEVGLPLTVLSIQKEHEIAVLEMGISEFGEMRRLSKIARPDICVITNIGYCHLENLHTRDGILQAKTEIFEYMSEDAVVCLNGDDDKLITLQSKKESSEGGIPGKAPVFFGIEEHENGNRHVDHQVYASEVCSKGLFGSTCRIHTPQGSFVADIPLPGTHMIQNALAATCVALELGLTLEQIREGIARVEAVGGRSHIIRGAQYTIIDDCYNANPVSMKSAIDLLKMADTRTVAILGDMFELGTDEVKMHAEIGAYAVDAGVDLLICVGKLSRSMYEAAAQGVQQTVYYETLSELQSALSGLLCQGDTILIKASHAMGFEAIVKELENEFSIWQEDHPVMVEAYSCENIREEIINPDSDICMIYFSGNGLYYPNEEKVVRETILINDRYEWERVSKNPQLQKYVGKEIFVRDVFKQWYVTGINKKVSSIDAMAKELEKRTKGYRVITVGNSAGGYGATLFGILLRAEMVFSFSGQFSIREGAFLEKYKEDESRSRYYNLAPLLEACEVPVMYFYPAKCQGDIEQHALVEHIKNVYSFPINQSAHGSTILGINYGFILTKDKEKMKQLNVQYSGKLIDQKEFLFRSAGFWRGVCALIRKYLGR